MLGQLKANPFKRGCMTPKCVTESKKNATRAVAST